MALDHMPARPRFAAVVARFYRALADRCHTRSRAVSQLDRKVRRADQQDSTPGTEAMASRFSSDWLVSIIGTMTSSLLTVSR